MEQQGGEGIRWRKMGREERKKEKKGEGKKWEKEREKYCGRGRRRG